MRRHGALFVLLGVLGALVLGLAVLFRLRLAHGDVFPEYSSLRSDPLGMRALHDSLAQVSTLRVERRFQPLRTLEAEPPRTIVLAGLPSFSLERVPRQSLDAIEAAVKSGSRLVLALRAKEAGRTDEEFDDGNEPQFEPGEMRKKKATAEKKSADKKSEEKKAGEKKADGKAPAKKEKAKEKEKDEEPDPLEEWERWVKLNFTEIPKRWGFEVKERFLKEGAGNVAVRGADAAGLPAQVAWHGDVYFKTDASAGWREIYKRGGEPVLVERSFGRGSIVLASDTYFLSNEALQRDRAAPLLAWIVGPNARVVFDEAHLGVVAQPGIAALARRYGLSAAFFTLVLLAALFVWRRMALFVPPAPEARDVALNYHPAAGLEALLRRAVPADQVVEACATEWKPTARPGDQRRVEAALAESTKGSVVDRYNAAVRALRRK